MRALIIYKRRRKLLFLLLCLVLFYSWNSTAYQWAKIIAERKVSEFTDSNLAVKIGEISGGIFGDMVLEDVVFCSGKSNSKESFAIDRMVISYRFWNVLLDKVTGREKKQNILSQVKLVFSDENPFVRGFIKLNRETPGKVEFTGRISPVLLGDRRKRYVEGTLTKRQDKKWDCSFLWNGNFKILGDLDPAGRAIELDFSPADESKRGIAKIKGEITEEGEVRFYSRFDKVDLYGTEIIGDFSLSFQDKGKPLFLFEAENLLIDKNPFWNITVGGVFSPEDDVLLLDNVRWGPYFTLFGKIKTTMPYESSLKMLFKDLPLHELTGMMGGAQVTFLGRAEGELDISGDILERKVKGRLYIADGVLDTMEFRSLFASLKGKLPIVEIVDSRVVKDGGNILVTGYMDFDKIDEGKAFDTISFDTDNKVAVWEDWQIQKEDIFNTVEATKDNFSLTTALEDDKSLRRISDPEAQRQKDIECNYDLDGANSLKIDFDREDDFFGLEHKIEF